jgi:hypothetical protein
MAIKSSKTNKPKEQGGKTGQQMAGRYKATSPYPTKIPKELDPYIIGKRLKDAAKKVKS